MLSTWHDDDYGGGTLELPEAATRPGPALELRVVPLDDGGTLALWLTEWGEVLRVATVGRA